MKNDDLTFLTKHNTFTKEFKKARMYNLKNHARLSIRELLKEPYHGKPAVLDGHTEDEFSIVAAKVELDDEDRME